MRNWFKGMGWVAVLFLVFYMLPDEYQNSWTFIGLCVIAYYVSKSPGESTFLPCTIIAINGFCGK